MNTESNANEGGAQKLPEETRALVETTADIAEESVARARDRLASALESAKRTCAMMRSKAGQQAHAADELLRAHPYQAMGVALSLGAVIGYFCRRRH